MISKRHFKVFLRRRKHVRAAGTEEDDDIENIIITLIIIIILITLIIILLLICSFLENTNPDENTDEDLQQLQAGPDVHVSANFTDSTSIMTDENICRQQPHQDSGGGGAAPAGRFTHPPSGGGRGKKNRENSRLNQVGKEEQTSRSAETK